MKIVKKSLFILTTFFFLFFPQVASADGGVFPPPNSYLTQTDQKAVIVFENNIETLILSVTFKGDPENFAWVIPVPAKPEVEKSQDELFTALYELTQPEAEIQEVPFFGAPLEGLERKSPITIIETKKIDIYDIKIITSDDPKALANWLSENDYQIPSTAAAILEDYVENDWYFVTVKIDLTKITALGKEQIKTGHATPLKIQFETEKIIYPLKLTSVISEYQSQNPNSKAIPGLTQIPQVSILLYVLADHKKDYPGFEPQYANWLEKDQIEDLAFDSEGESWYKTSSKKLYLTRLYNTLKTSEMTSDLFLRDAASDDPVGEQKASLWLNILVGLIVFAIVFIIFVLSPLGLVFWICSLVQFLSKSKAAKIISWILQIIFFLISALVVLIMILFNLSSPVSYTTTFNQNILSTAAIIGGVVFVLAEISVMILQIWHQRKLKRLKPKSEPDKIGDKIFDMRKE